ncbi:MAG: transposase, partial [Cetobacterium sp.]
MQSILILKVYITIGGKIYRIKEVLELWVRANESSKYWLNVLTEIRDRGVEDILIISINNLKYFMSDLKEVYKATT